MSNGYTIFGDGNDNTAELQAIINFVYSLPDGSGQSVRLEGHTKINWDKFTWPAFNKRTFRLEINGKLECTGGIIEPPNFVTIAGISGGVGTFAGGFTRASASISRTGVTVSDRAFSTLSIQDKTQFAIIYGIPGDFLTIGAPLTITGSAHNDGRWTIISWFSQPAAPPFNNVVRAVKSGAVANDPNTFDWTVGSHRGTGQIGPVFDCFRFTGAANLDASCWKGFLYVRGPSQPLHIDGMHRIVGAESSTDGYCVNYTVTNNATLPDANNGSILGALELPVMRIPVTGSVTLSDLAIANPPGIGILIDTGNNVTIRSCHLSDYGVGSLVFNEGSIPLVIDSSFEDDIEETNFQTNSTTNGPNCNVFITYSQNVGFTGLLNFRRCRASGAGFFINTIVPQQGLGFIVIDDFIIENQIFPLLILDPRNVQIGSIGPIRLIDVQITDKDPSLLDQISSPVPCTPLQLRALKIEGGTLHHPSIKLLHPNVQFASIQRDDTTQIPQNVSVWGSPRYFSYQNDISADFALTSTGATMAPTISPDVIYLDLYDDPFDALNPWSSLPTLLGNPVTVTIVRAPNGLMEAAQLHATSTDSIELGRNNSFGLSTLPNNVGVGDYFITGTWIRSIDATKSASPPIIMFYMPQSGQIVNFDNGPALINYQDDGLARDGGGWRLITKIAKVTAIPLGPANLFQFFVGVSANIDLAYWKPFAIYIPVSKGYTDDEITRFYRHIRDFVHGAPVGTAAVPKSVKLGFGTDTNIYRSTPGILSSDNTFNTAREIDVNGTRSVWRRQPAIVNADGTLNSLTAQFNTLLDSLRTHGLIDGMWTPGRSTPDAFWYESNQVTQSGGRVSMWTDQSGGGHNVTQTTAGFKPFFSAANPLFNYKPVLQFKLSYLDGGVFDTFAGDQATIALVFNIPKSYAIGNAQIIIGKQDLIPNNAWYIGTDFTQATTHLSFFVNNSAIQAIDTITPNDGITHLIVATYDGANVNLYRDGIQVASHAQTGAINNTGDHFGIGAYIDASGSPAAAIGNMDMAMAIGWKRVLTAAEMAYLRIYTQITYGTL